MTATAVLDGVSRTFGGTTAVRQVSVDLRPGVVGLLGPNGAGKTTLLRLLSTSLPPSATFVSRLIVIPPLRRAIPTWGLHSSCRVTWLVRLESNEKRFDLPRQWVRSITILATH